MGGELPLKPVLRTRITSVLSTRDFLYSNTVIIDYLLLSLSTYGFAGAAETPEAEARSPRMLKKVTFGWQHSTHTLAHTLTHRLLHSRSRAPLIVCDSSIFPYPVPLARPSSHLYRSEHNWEPP
jgi:hypothetical protein